MPTPWSDLSRPPLSAARLRLAFEGRSMWREIRVVQLTASTNADAVLAAREGAADGLVVIAEQQSAGRGRLDRSWQSPARAGVLLSVLLRPPVDPARWPLLSLVAGLATAEGLVSVGDVDARLKWPNDVMVDGLKLGGILAERVDDAVVVGIGINVSTRRDELPVDSATSLALLGGSTDREILLKEVLRALSRRYEAWRDTDGNGTTVMPAYRERCETIGQHVDLHLPGGDVVRGNAVGIDDDGQLVLRDDATGAERAWLVGDVTKVRKVS
jgi:BirA family biotin operon repressor/biotin-[acetyl-CoA-carboxylase] ligase